MDPKPEMVDAFYGYMGPATINMSFEAIAVVPCGHVAVEGLGFSMIPIGRDVTPLIDTSQPTREINKLGLSQTALSASDGLIHSDSP